MRGLRPGRCSLGDDGNRVVYYRLPTDIEQRQVLLLDPILATGRSVSKVRRAAGGRSLL